MLQRQVPFVFRDLKTDEQAAEEIREAFNGALPFPVLSIDGSWLRNPSHPQLLKRLARHGRYDHPLVHQPLSHRFVKYLPGEDAVVQYKKKGASLSDGLVLMHIELPQAQRGKGLGQQIAHGLFEQLIQQQIPATLHCSFLKGRPSRSQVANLLSGAFCLNHLTFDFLQEGTQPCVHGTN